MRETSETLIVRAGAGDRFAINAETMTIRCSGEESGGRHAILHWVLDGGGASAPHHHETYEECFHLLRGRLVFLLGDTETELGPGDFARVPAGMRHGFHNPDDTPVEAIVTFAPGGIEALFRRHRTDGGRPFDLARYLEEAAREHGTHYEIPGR